MKVHFLYTDFRAVLSDLVLEELKRKKYMPDSIISINSHKDRHGKYLTIEVEDPAHGGQDE